MVRSFCIMAEIRPYGKTGPGNACPAGRESPAPAAVFFRRCREPALCPAGRAGVAAKLPLRIKRNRPRTGPVSFYIFSDGNVVCFKPNGLLFRGKGAIFPLKDACPVASVPFEKARWGRDGGPGGKGNTSRASRGVSLPPNSGRIVLTGPRPLRRRGDWSYPRDRGVRRRWFRGGLPSRRG